MMSRLSTTSLNPTIQTADVLHSFILAMGLHPEVMRRAQAQIDAAVGRDRMPNFGDVEHLPYITAIVREALRWKMIAPVGQSGLDSCITCDSVTLTRYR